MMSSLFSLFVIEMWLHSKGAGHSHGSATGEEFGRQQPPRPQTSHSAHSEHSEHSELSELEKDIQKNFELNVRSVTQEGEEGGEGEGEQVERELTYETVDKELYRKMSLNITLLEGGILFHSVFVGMTVSIETDGFITLLIAILFHQTFEGLGLGSRIAAVPYPKKSIRPWLLVFAFGTTAPIGQAIGLVARQSYDPNSAFALILVGTFNAMYAFFFFF